MVPAQCLAYDSLFATEASRMTGDIDMPGRYVSRFSEVLEKGEVPNGMGFNWQTVVTNNTLPSNPVVWTSVQANSGGSGTCVAVPNPILGSSNILSYSAFQTRLTSEQICLLDAQFSYDFGKQSQNKKINFERNIVDVTQDRDRGNYIAMSTYKGVLANGLPQTVNNPGTYATTGNIASGFPLIPATSPLTQDFIAYQVRLLDRDGSAQAGGGYDMKDGKAIYLVFMDSETQQYIIKTSPETRQDFRYSDMGMGEKATLRKKFGLDRPYGGAFQMIDDRMPRFTFDSVLGYVEVPFFINSPVASVGVNEAIPNPAYETAPYTMCIFFHPKVVKRLVPRALSTVGAGTTFGPIAYNGDVTWLNIQDQVCNPQNTIGFWNANLMYAYRPDLVQYGRCFIYSRCTNQLFNYPGCY